MANRTRKKKQTARRKRKAAQQLLQEARAQEMELLGSPEGLKKLESLFLEENGLKSTPSLDDEEDQPGLATTTAEEEEGGRAGRSKYPRKRKANDGVDISGPTARGPGEKNNPGAPGVARKDEEQRSATPRSRKTARRVHPSAGRAGAKKPCPTSRTANWVAALRNLGVNPISTDSVDDVERAPVVARGKGSGRNRGVRVIMRGNGTVRRRNRNKSRSNQPEGQPRSGYPEPASEGEVNQMMRQQESRPAPTLPAAPAGAGHPAAIPLVSTMPNATGNFVSIVDHAGVCQMQTATALPFHAAGTVQAPPTHATFAAGVAAAGLPANVTPTTTTVMSYPGGTVLPVMAAPATTTAVTAPQMMTVNTSTTPPMTPTTATYCVPPPTPTQCHSATPREQQGLAQQEKTLRVQTVLAYVASSLNGCRTIVIEVETGTSKPGLAIEFPDEPGTLGCASVDLFPIGNDSELPQQLIGARDLLKKWSTPEDPLRISGLLVSSDAVDMEGGRPSCGNNGVGMKDELDDAGVENANGDFRCDEDMRLRTWGTELYLEPCSADPSKAPLAGLQPLRRNHKGWYEFQAGCRGTLLLRWNPAIPPEKRDAFFCKPPTDQAMNDASAVSVPGVINCHVFKILFFDLHYTRAERTFYLCSVLLL